MKDLLHRIASVVAVVVVGGTLAVAQDSSRPRQTFHSAADLVTIQASVRDSHGRVVPGLTSSDFEIRDNGELRPILSLRSDRESPLSLAIVVDMSGSMRIGPKIAMARQAYASLLSQLQSGQDEVALFTFDSSLHERRGFTRDLSVMKDALAEFQPFGSTSLYDAAAESARRLAARSAAHKAVVVLTDGVDTSSALNAREVSGLASSIDVPVFVVATMSADQRLALEATERSPATETADLRDLAEWTGGAFVVASTRVETIVGASTLIDDLRQQYVLAIEAAPGREWRRLDVRVKRRSAAVKARSGYYGG